MLLIHNGKDAETRRRGGTEKLQATFTVFSPRPRVSASPRRMIALLAIILAGCSTQEKVQYDPVEKAPIVGDDAMTMRQWPAAKSYYPNGDTAAWSTRFPITTNPNRPEAQNLVLEPVLFIGQTVLLPIEFIANPPFQPQVYYGVEYRPTYTFQPPLPPPGGAPPQGGTVGYGAAGPSMQSGGGGYGAGGAAGR